MTEEEFKTAVQNMLMMQNNNDHNFKILQEQIDRLNTTIAELEKKQEGLEELRTWMRLPKPENMNRKPFEEVD